MLSNSSPRTTGPSKFQHLRVALRILRFLHFERRTAVIAAIIVVARIATEVTAVYFFSPVVTAISTKGLSRSLSPILIGMVLTQVALSVFVYLRAVWDCKLSMRTVFHIRGAVFDQLQHCGFSFHDRMSSGQLINRAISDLQSVRMLINASVLTSLDIVISIGGYLVLLLFRSPLLMLACLIPLPLWIFVVHRFNTRARPVYRAQQEASDQVMSVLVENVSGVHVVRSFGNAGLERAKYKNANELLKQRYFRSAEIQARLTPMLRGITVATHVMLFVLASWLIKEGHMVVGDLLILGSAMTTILTKLQSVSGLIDTYQRAVVSGRRLFEVLDQRREIPGRTSKKQSLVEPIVCRGEILFREVTFGYDANRPVLHQLNTLIPAGRITALVGSTGSGKTTMAQLIARFYEPQSGSISIDSQDIRLFSPDLLRRKVGYVFQETFLFSETIDQNIRYGRPDVSEEMVRRAAAAAGATEFIDGLPRGFDTPLGDQGVCLSGGQRQRIALARALVYDPEILILDDAMAALDARTEDTVRNAIAPLLRGRTVIVIAHRLATLQSADQVLVLSQGRIVQQGTPDQLRHGDGHFANLLRSQLGNGSPAASAERSLTS